jgi:beta-glucuronidase
MNLRLKIKNIGCVIFSLVISQFCQAQLPMGNVMSRNTQNLNGKWQVIIDWYNRDNGIAHDDTVPNKNTFREYRFDGTTLNVPGDWNSQRPELKYYEGSIWYKKNITFHRIDGKRTYLYFSGVSYQADVYLNGEKIGSHEGGFTPFQFEVSSSIKEGLNDLIVRVNNQRRPDGIPALSFDWWNYGGITRDVYLVQSSETYIDDYFIQLKKNSVNTIAGWVKLKGSAKTAFVTINIPELKISRQFKVGENGEALIDVKANFELWSPQKPKLYDVIITSPADTVKERIGFRSVQVNGTQVLLNGNPIFLKGISFHEEIPQRQARATNDADAKQLLTWAKELGCNFVRLAHYPQNEHTVRMAEAMGLMMWEEIPVWQGIAFNDPVILDKAKNMLGEMVARDKNRCGIIIWSLSNETAPSVDRNRVLKQMASNCRDLDSTRLVSSAFDHFKSEGNKIIIDDELSNSLDVIAANRYMGWYSRWPARPGEVVWQSRFNKPVIISEFGGEALYGQHGPADDMSLWTEEYQEQLYKDNISMFNTIPFLAGVCPWVLTDFRTPFRMNLKFQNGWNRKGLLSDKGEKKRAWYVMKDFYSTR